MEELPKCLVGRISFLAIVLLTFVELCQNVQVAVRLLSSFLMKRAHCMMIIGWNESLVQKKRKNFG